MVIYQDISSIFFIKNQVNIANHKFLTIYTVYIKELEGLLPAEQVCLELPCWLFFLDG